MAAGNINLLNLDFDTIKESFKAYLKNQDTFKDYDFEGSNMSVLLDLLAYNTYLNSFYTNMVASEMFLDTAQLRDSLISHAKELNYLPRSFKSSEAVINISVNAGNLTITSLTMPKGTTFTTKVDNKTFSFATDSNIVLFGSGGVFSANNVSIYEGEYITESFVVDESTTTQRFVISNGTVDTSTIIVTVIEDNGATSLTYSYASSLFNLNDQSQVFFLQPAENEKYEIIFGDNVTGRKPKNGATIVVEYRDSSGELPNGAYKFTSDGPIDGYSDVTVTTVTKAIGGSVSESLESIRFNAPRHFSTQERAITPSDYETLLKTNYPEIQAVSAYGGEQADPPQYGRVFVSIDIKNVDGIPQSKVVEYTNFLTRRAPVSIEPVFVSPDPLNLYIESLVRYDTALTDLSPNDITTIVISAINSFNSNSLSDFKKTFRFSRLVNAIDTAHPSIVSNETRVKAIRKIQPVINELKNYTINFDQALFVTNDTVEPTVSSSVFFYNSSRTIIVDDGAGTIKIVGASDPSRTSITDIGTVDYGTGRITLQNFRVSDYLGTAIKIYARINSDDIFSIKNSIITISEEDLAISSIASKNTPDNGTSTSTGTSA